MATDGDPRSDESLPPITTRRSDEPAQDPADEAHELAPPFTPGRSPAPSEPEGRDTDVDAAAASAEPEPTTDTSAGAESIGAVAGAEPTDESMDDEPVGDEPALGDGAFATTAGLEIEEDEEEIDPPFVGAGAPGPLGAWEDEDEGDIGAEPEDGVAGDEDAATDAAGGSAAETDAAGEIAAEVEADVSAFEEDVAAYASGEPEDDYDDFPVESFDLEGSAEDATERSTADLIESDVEEWSPVDLYADEDDGTAAEAGEGESTAGVEDEAEPTESPEAGVRPGEMDAASTTGEVGTPPEARDPEPWADTPVSEPEPERTVATTGPAPGASSLGASGQETEKLATHLERLARLVREEGPEALRSEMDSTDRFNAALAGLLAGYLARP